MTSGVPRASLSCSLWWQLVMIIGVSDPMPILYDPVCYINYLSSVPTGIQLPICLEIWLRVERKGKREWYAVRALTLPVTPW